MTSDRNRKGQFTKGNNGKRVGKTNRSGYWYIKRWDHPHCGRQGYVAEHRLVMEEKIGRYLRPEEAVHHIDHNRKNNHPDNLELYPTHGQHTKLCHPEVYEKARLVSLGRRPPNYNRGIKICPNCNVKYESNLGQTKRNKKYCTAKCYNLSRLGKMPKNIEGLKLGWGWNKKS